MELFDLYQSRTLQLFLDIQSLTVNGEYIEKQTIDALAKDYGMSYDEIDSVLKMYCGAKLLEKVDRNTYLLSKAPPEKPDGEGFLGVTCESYSPKLLLPVSLAEEDYLQYILRQPQAKLFLSDSLRESLSEPHSSDLWESAAQRIPPAGAPLPDIPREDFQTILTAIRQGRQIRYQYRTRVQAAYQEAVSLPWKLEYSSYDRRWWIILYDEQEERTVKAILGNLRDVRLGVPSQVTEDKILQAMDKLLAPEPMVLAISNEKNAVERSFLAFEHQLFTDTERQEDGSCTMTFRYYRFDEGEILRRLLYLGPCVVLKQPEYMKQKLLRLLDEAL